MWTCSRSVARLAALAVGLAILTVALGCAPRPAESPPGSTDEARPSIVLVTLDTTRADRIGAYGHADAATPVIDALADGGVLFERAYATVPLTIPSHASMLTGLFPPRHGVRTNGDAILPDDLTTLAEALRDGGYATAASVSAFVTTRMWNLDQGFDAYFDDVTARSAAARRWGRERPADRTVDDAIGWLEGRSGPFFLWVHLYDPHHPHEAPEPFASAHADPYDAEIAFVDAQIGRLKEAVDRSGPAAWLVVGDHGEAFGEHGEQAHGMFVFEPTMRVPFVVRLPDALPAARRVTDTAVSVADVMPTALGIAGLPVPDDLDGVDLTPLLRGEEMPRAPVYLESRTVTQRLGYHPEVAVVHGRWKLLDTPDARLYDVVADPGEETNRIAEHPEEVARLRAVREAIAARTRSMADAVTDPAVLAQLEALGYLTGGAGVPGDAAVQGARSTIDAKTRLDVLRRLDETRRRAADPARTLEVEAAYREILLEEPDLNEARTGLARMLQRQRRLPEAEEELRRALAVEPESSVVRVMLANVLAARQQHDEALAELEGILVRLPGDDVARDGVIRTLAEAGRENEALARARAWLVDNPKDRTLQAHVGVLLARRGETAAAIPLLRASLEDGVPRRHVHRALGEIALEEERPEAAAEHFRRELDRFPVDPDLRSRLADALMRAGEWDEAAAEYAFLVEVDPTRVDARHGQAQAVFNAGDYPLADQLVNRALDVEPGDPHLHLLRANVLDKLGRREEAEAAFRRANALRGGRGARRGP